MSQKIEFSVVIPCLNEAETIGICINKATAKLKEMKVEGEVIIGDNGSTDGSIEIAESLGARVINVKKKGYGNALFNAINESLSNYIVVADADDSYDFNEIDKFYYKLKEGSDFVMGCRLPSGKGKVLPGAMPALHYYLGNPLLTSFVKFLFNSKMDDINCGMRAFTRDAFEKMKLTTGGMEFACEMVIKANIWKLKIEQVPVTLHPAGRTRAPHLKSWSDGWKMLRFMLLMAPDGLFKIPGIILTILGIIFTGLVFSKPFHIAGIVLDVNTYIVSTLMIVVGYQTLLFSEFSKRFSSRLGILPETKRVQWNLNRMILISILVILSGLAVIGFQFLKWAHLGFGLQDYGESLRMIIPGTLCCILGLQTFFGSFFMGVLELKTIRE